MRKIIGSLMLISLLLITASVAFDDLMPFPAAMMMATRPAKTTVAQTASHKVETKKKQSVRVYRNLGMPVMEISRDMFEF